MAVNYIFSKIIPSCYKLKRKIKSLLYYTQSSMNLLIFFSYPDSKNTRTAVVYSLFGSCYDLARVHPSMFRILCESSIVFGITSLHL